MYWTVRPSALTKCPNAAATSGLSLKRSAPSCAGVRVRPVKSSGPVTSLNSPLPCSDSWTAWRSAGWVQIGVENRKRNSVACNVELP